MGERQESKSRSEPAPLDETGSTSSGQEHHATVAPSGAGDAPDGSRSAPSVEVGTQIDTYRIIEKLGQGGMGSVWKALHLKLDKVVAIKLLPPHLLRNAEAVRRFEREMRAVGKLEHPHIVRAMDAREVNGMHVLVMEHVEGVDLARLVKTGGSRSVKDACAMVRQAALGLAAAHSMGLIHRDIKPSNLLLTKQGQVKVLDLGLARLMDEVADPGPLTQSGQVFGTPDYMAPEQWDDSHSVDARADVYALGCTLCYLLIGRAPFGDRDHTAMTQKMKGHLLETPPRLSDLRSGIPDELERLFERLIAKEPAARPGSASEVAAILKEIASGLASGLTAGPGAPAPPQAQRAAGPVASPTVRERHSVAAAEPSSPSSMLPYLAMRRKRNGDGTTLRQLRIAAMMGAAVLLIVLGVAVIRIVNRDGTVTEIKVPPESTVEFERNDGSVVRVRPDDGRKPTTTTGPSAPSPAVTPFDDRQARAHQQEWAKFLRTTIEKKSPSGLKLVVIPPGTFQKGATQAEVDAFIHLVNADNAAQQGWFLKHLRQSVPPQKVTLTKPWRMSTTEVTVGQFRKFIESTGYKTDAERDGKGGINYPGGQLRQSTEIFWSNPGHPQTEDCPVLQVSWYDAAEFCNWLSRQEKLEPSYVVDRDGAWQLVPGTGYRLPTEAEWEFACRAGTTTAYFFGDEATDLEEYAWFERNSEGRTQSVGAKRANPFGLFDILGNAREWVHDAYDDNGVVESSGIDPRGPASGALRILRGSNWVDHSAYSRSMFRGGSDAFHRDCNNSFRVAASVNTPSDEN